MAATRKISGEANDKSTFMTNGKDVHNPKNGVELKEYLESILDERITKIERIQEERDKQYDYRFKSVDATAAAFQRSQEKIESANDKAILKAEDSQKEYNIRSNEFRGQLDDQAKTLMPRNEADARFFSMTEKSDAGFKTLDNKVETLRTDTQLKFEVLRTDVGGKFDLLRIDMSTKLEAVTREIAGLRESRSAGESKDKVTDPVLAESLRDIKSLLITRSETGGKVSGANQLWLYAVGALGAISIIWNIIRSLP